MLYYDFPENHKKKLNKYSKPFYWWLKCDKGYDTSIYICVIICHWLGSNMAHIQCHCLPPPKAWVFTGREPGYSLGILLTINVILLKGSLENKASSTPTYIKKTNHTQQKQSVICLFTYMSDQYNIHFVIMHIRYKHKYLLFKKMR